MTAPPATTQPVPQCCPVQGRALVALAKTMLDTVVRCHEAVLQDDHETLTVIRHVAGHVLATSSALDGASFAAADLERSLQELFAFVVRAPEEPLTDRTLCTGFAPPNPAAVSLAAASEPGCEEVIAQWFWALSRELDAIHPQAAQMLCLRLLGLGSRQIAERLVLPPRLVRRVFQAARSGCVFKLAEAGDAA